MAVDGTLKFDTKIDTDGAEKDIRTLKQSLSNLIQTLTNTGKGIDDAFSGKSSRITDLNGKIEVTQAKIEKLTAEMEQMANTPFASKDADKLSQQIEKAEKQMLGLLNQREALEGSISGGISSLGIGGVSPEALQSLCESNTQWQSLTAKINQVESTLNKYEGELKQVQATDSQTSSADTSAYQDKKIKLEQLTNQLSTYKAKLSEVQQKEAAVAKSTNGMGSSIKKAAKNTDRAKKSTGELGKMLQLLKMSLMFSIAFKALSGAVNAIKAGFQNLAQYSTATNKNLSILATSLLTLKNSFATAFNPILTAITPALQTFINYLANAITVVGQFFAVFLNGATTFTRAKEAQVDYAASLKKTAKEANKALSPIDKLNNVSDSSGGGADTPGMPNPAQMFKEVPIDSKITKFVSELKKQLESLMQAFERFKVSIAPFTENIGKGLKWFLDNVIIPLGKWTVNSLLPGFLDVLGAAVGVLNSVIEVFKPYAKWLWDNFLKPVAEWTGGMIIEALKKLTGGLNSLSKWIMENKETFANATLLIGSFFAAFKIAEFIMAIAPLLTALGGFVTSGGLAAAVASGLGTALAALTSPAAVITAVLGLLIYSFIDLYSSSEDFRKAIKELGSTWKTALQPLADFVGTVLTDAWTKILKPAVDFFIKTLLPQLIETFKNLWQKVLVPYANFIGTVLQPVMKRLGDILTMLWKDIVLPLAQAVGSVFKEAWNSIYTILNKTVMPILNVLITTMTSLWKNVINPIVTVLWENLKPAFETVFKDIGNRINGLKEILTGTMKFITGVFTADWKKAWEGVKSIFKGVFDTFESIVKTPLSAVLNIVYGLINSVIDGVNTMIGAINKISFTVPKWIPEFGGNSVGFNLKPVAPLKVPKLATGAVIPPNSQFLAMLGDQKRGLNIEAPLDTIVDAFLKVGGGSNSGSGMLHVTLMLPDGKVLLDTVVKAEKEASGAIGKPAFEY